MQVEAHHKNSKGSAYWADLTARETHAYRQICLDQLLEEHFRRSCVSILELGVGTDTVLLDYKHRFGAARAVGVDYDEPAIRRMRQAYPEASWQVADIMEMRPEGRYDLVLLLDVVHEIYSFYGRPGRQLSERVDHALGLQAVGTMFDNLCGSIEPGGAIALTDNVLPNVDRPMQIRMRHQAARAAVERFVDTYPSKKISASWDGDVLSLPASDLCVLLTQYNKIKQGKEDRWEVERMEVHQYMSEAEYCAFFARLGFATYAILGTPSQALSEWEEDFDLVAGGEAFPHKRITLLAVRRA